jgi:competence protein ComEC
VWDRFRGWPLAAQIVLWVLLWPALFALLILRGHRGDGKGRPIAAVAVLALGGPLWLSALTAGSADPVGVEIADAAGTEAHEAVEEPADEPEPEGQPEPDPEPAPEPEPTADPDPEPEPEIDAEPDRPSPVEGELEVYFFDVGQGDATLLKHADATVLIDTGRHQASDVAPYLRSVGVDELDLLVVTHPHADHIGQFDKVIDSLPVAEVWWSGSTATSQTFARAVDALERSDAAYEEPRAGDVSAVGPLLVEVANPPSSISLTDLHDASLAFRVTYGDVRLLFTGDAEAATESRMVSQAGGTLDADILQLGHHGSKTSTTASFLSAVDPAVAIYSASSANQYGHPHAEVLDRLGAAGVDVYGTAVHGTVTVTTDGTGWTVSTDRTGTPAAGGSTSRSSNSSGSTSGRTSSGGTTASPSPSPSPTVTQEPAAPSACSAGQVDINSAGFDELQRIIHIGPDRAQQIPGLRPFASVSSMDRISGIAAVRLADIIAQGVACVG